MWKDHKDVGVADLEGGEAWGGGSQLTPNSPNETPRQRSHWPWMSMWTRAMEDSGHEAKLSSEWRGSPVLR